MTPDEAPAPAAIETDALIVGAGPTGLFLAFELGLLETAAHIVDSLPEAGGQCVQLYADKPIYDIPGLPFCTGRELVAHLQRQLAPFDPPLHLDQELSRLAPREDGTFDAETSAGTRFHAKTVFVAAGVGSFQPRPLKVAGIERFMGRQVMHRMPAAESLAGRRVLVVGGEDDALDAALTAASVGASAVTLLHRREVFDAAAPLVARLHEAVQAGHVRLVAGQAVAATTEGDRLAAIEMVDTGEASHRVEVDLVLVFLGISPRLGPVADWGVALQRRQVIVDTERFETDVPGLYAVGDIVTYPGKRKLILCGFHEATLAAYAAASRLRPDEPVLLQYTTTSPKLHRLLGVAPFAVD